MRVPALGVLPIRLPSRRDLRLASGLVLFGYVALHLIDHAFGLVSLELAEAALALSVALWHSAPGTLLLYGAAATHVGLALLAVYERRTLRMPPLHALRIALGLWMPVVLLAHFAGTRIAFERYGLTPDYARVVVALWDPQSQGRQLALLVPGWLHGCLGLKIAFSGRCWWRRLQPAQFAAALLLPLLAGLGFVSMGRHLERAPHPAVMASAAQQAELDRLLDRLLASYGGAVALVFGARGARALVERRRRSLVTISYPQRNVRVPRGWSVLDASRAFGIAHLSLCGGRARCSTCRVRVVAGAEHCPPIEIDERRTLERLRAADDVRLACQLRPSGNIGVEPLLAAAGPDWRGTPAPEPTTERAVAILVAEWRRARAAANDPHRSAHDTVYALNLFLEAAGDAVHAADGALCASAGHGAIAVFGLHGSLDKACRQALRAAQRIEQTCSRLNERLAVELGAHGELTLALHAGVTVIGRVGHREARSLSLLGPGIDAARKLCEFAQAEGLGFVVSEAALQALGVRAALPWRTVGIDGAPLRAQAAPSSADCIAAAAH